MISAENTCVKSDQKVMLQEDFIGLKSTITEHAAETIASM